MGADVYGKCYVSTSMCQACKTCNLINVTGDLVFCTGTCVHCWQLRCSNIDWTAMH